MSGSTITNNLCAAKSSSDKHTAQIMEVKSVKGEKDDFLDSIEEWELDEDEVDLSAKVIEPKSPAKTMSIMTMGKMLGLGKTDSYWLAHKNAFKVITVAGQMRVDIDSFEKWYANQVKYHKVDGTPPGEELKSKTYDAKDIAEILGICEDWVYEILKAQGLKYIIVDYWRRWPKKVFDEWYQSQSRYRNKEDRERDLLDIERTLSMPEMAFLLGVHRNTVYTILAHPDNIDIFDIVIVADRKRITKDSFKKWYYGQCRYKMRFDSIEEAQAIKAESLPLVKPKAAEITPLQKESARPVTLSGKSSNPDYYSLDEVSEKLDVKKSTVKKMIRENIIPYVSVAGSYRIPKLDFDRWMIEQQEYLESEE